MVPQRRRVISATLWRDLSITTAEYAIAASLALATLSTVAVATGDPETVALVAGFGLLVLLVGMLLVRTFEYGRANGVPVLD
jgi:hypothetical protein